MKKIKSVKLKNDYRARLHYIPKGKYLKYHYNFESWELAIGISLTQEQIEDCKTDLFEIEYESERKYIDVRIEYYNDSILGDFDTSWFDHFKNYISSKCSTERKVEITIMGRGTL